MPLKWTYRKPHGLGIQRTVFSIEYGMTVDEIGVIYHFEDGSVSATIHDRNDYRTRFDIRKSEMATLIINKVTERERATFKCKLVTRSNGEWAYNIRLNKPTGKI